MPIPVTPLFARRVTAAFTALALGVVALSWFAWSEHLELQQAQASRSRSEQVLATLAEVQMRATPQLRLVLCVAAGDSAQGAAEITALDWSVALRRLQELVVDLPEQRERALSLGKALDEWRQSYETPLRQACASGQRLGVAHVVSLARVVAPQRERVEALLGELRLAEATRLGSSQARVSSASESSRRWWAVLTSVAVLLALVAVVAVGGLARRLVTIYRRWGAEHEEREMTQEHLDLARRQLRIVVDTVRDAVISFDERNRIKWVNPAAETLFRTSRRLVVGSPVARLLPDFDEALRKVPAARSEGSHGALWVVHRVTLDAVRQRVGAAHEALPVDVALARSSVEGHVIGLCVLRGWGAIAAPAAPSPREAASV